MADRRDRQRFEIVGHLHGALTTVEPLQLHNISVGGALVEAARPLPRDSVHEFRIEVDAHPARVTARIRHVRQWEQRFLLGLEFIASDDDLIGRIAALVLSDREAPL